MQRKEMARSGRNAVPRAPTYPTYTPPVTSVVQDSYDSYAAEKNKKLQPTTTKGKGMQLGKKSKTTSMFNQVRGDLGPEAEPSAPLTSSSPAPRIQAAASTRTPIAATNEGILVTVVEAISARLTREGTVESFDVKGDLQLKITDPTLSSVKLNLTVDDLRSAQYKTHPKVDRALFNNNRVIQLKEANKGFPTNNAIGVMRWTYADKSGDSENLPITFTIWVNDNGGGTFNVTVEYELMGGDTLRDVTVAIPYATSEPQVSSFDAVYQVTGDSVEWTIGTVDADNSSGSFEFEAHAESDAEFFPMSVGFAKTKPFVNVDVSHGPDLYGMNQRLLMRCLRVGLVDYADQREPRHLLREECQV